jgi:hypothetical protein
MITPTLVTPAPTREALTDQSSPEEIFQRVRDSDRSWHTLWLDAQIIDYGPPGYIGLPFVRREQLWLISNQQGLYLSGVEGNPQPERIALSLNGTEYSFSPGETPPRIANGGPILGYTQLAQLIQPQFNDSLGHKLEILGIEKVANRDAIVVNHFYVEESGDNFHARYSIDARTGVPLRLLTYIDKAHQTLSQEIRITDIRYDQDFPPELFDPFSGVITHFAQGPGGEQQESASLAARLEGVNTSSRKPLPHRSPPPDFDPTQSQLVFQFPTLIRLGGARDLAEIFADGYYLGTLEFADPWNLNCTRSPNGRYIAFYPWLEEEPFRGSLHWFDLLDPTKLHNPVPDLLPSWANMAFSPDNRQIAFVACRILDNDCTLYMLDLASNEARSLVDILVGNSLSWSPDGRQIAFLGTFPSDSDWMVYVIDAQSGEITYSGPMDWENNAPANPGAPINSWGVTFPNWNTGLEACTAPPD